MGQNKKNFVQALFPCSVWIGKPPRLLVSHTQNIEEGGIMVPLKEKLRITEIVDLKISLGDQRIIRCKGMVSSVKENSNAISRYRFETKINFTQLDDSIMDDPTRREISRLVNATLKRKNGSNKSETPGKIPNP